MQYSQHTGFDRGCTTIFFPSYKPSWIPSHWAARNKNHDKLLKKIKRVLQQKTFPVQLPIPAATVQSKKCQTFHHNHVKTSIEY
jgi:hypothetical protein